MLSGEEYVIVFVINRDIFTFPSLCRSIVLTPFSCHVHEMFVSSSIVVDGEFITHAEVCTGLVRGLKLNTNLPGIFGLYPNFFSGVRFHL
jgi:hypothetical protein